MRHYWFHLEEDDSISRSIVVVVALSSLEVAFKVAELWTGKEENLNFHTSGTYVAKECDDLLLDLQNDIILIRYFVNDDKCLICTRCDDSNRKIMIVCRSIRGTKDIELFDIEEIHELRICRSLK